MGRNGPFVDAFGATPRHGTTMAAISRLGLGANLTTGLSVGGS